MMTKAKLNTDFIATAAGDITVFNFDSETREYLQSSVEFLAVGVGMPANSCADAPPATKGGYVVCRTTDLSGWEYAADHRGETVYSTETGKKITITASGDYPAGSTTLAPLTKYDAWNGNEWVTNLEAQHAAEVEAAEQKKSSLLANARGQISLWQTELQLGSISEGDKTSLVAWLAYIKALQVIDTSLAPDIRWPAPPEQ